MTITNAPATRAGSFRVGDLDLNRIGYGAMQLAGPGVFGPPRDRAGAIEVLRTVVDMGVNHIDTADAYGPRVTNELIRAAYQALLQDGTAPGTIVFAGDSAGGGRAVATLVNTRDHGLTLPAAAFVMSPYVDLTLAGKTMETKRAPDPLMSLEALRARVPDYTSGHDAGQALISPLFAELTGLPSLIIQAGTHEVPLDDAVRLAREAAVANVEVTLDITPGVPHVFQAYHAILDKAVTALDRARQLLSAQLARTERVTA